MDMLEQMMTLLQAQYRLQAFDPGEFSQLRAKGMRFTVLAWNAEGLGNVSWMHAQGFLGLMKMDTLIVNPREVDLPLYSYDRILAMGSDTLIAELYDTTVGGFSAPALDRVVKEAADLPDRGPGVHWYDDIRLPQSISKKGKKARTPAFDRLALDHMRAWLHAECKPLTDRDAKRAKTNAYVNGLLEHGGPSTDVFKQVLGAEKTAELFHRVLFGTN